MGTRIITKAYVPQGAKQRWSQCLVAALSQVTAHNDDKAWRELFMLPKAVLRSAVRGGGKKGKTTGEEETNMRVREWLSGNRSDVCSEERKRKEPKAGEEKRKAKENGGSEKRARAEELAKEGLFSKACMALISEPPVDVDDAVENEMKLKHPDERTGEKERAALLRPVSSAAAIQVNDDEVRKCGRLSKPFLAGLRAARPGYGPTT